MFGKRTNYWKPGEYDAELILLKELISFVITIYKLTLLLVAFFNVVLFILLL